MMRPHLDIAHDGTLGDERTKMTFDENSIAHLMSILTDLYSDPVMAVIREYTTNALDSHRAAGQTRPVEVEIPTSLRPIFVVRDFGTGMTVNQITDQFSKYGWSSKRASDDEVGMLGLGCKSALSYTSQFTMVSVCDGVEVVVLVTREADGAGAVQIVDTSATDKPNGVEVQIPVASAWEFEQKSKEFFRFTEPGCVLVNGKEPPLVGYSDDDIKLTDVILLTASVAHDYVVMGNVPYPIKDDGNHALLKRAYDGNHKCAVVRVPIGSVNFTPSREQLHYTKRTVEFLTGIRQEIAAVLVQRAQAEVSAAANATEALRAARKWRHIVSCKKLTYDVPVPYSPVLPDSMALDHPKNTMRWCVSRHSDSPANRVNDVKLDELLDGVHIIGHKGGCLQAGTKKRLFKLLSDRGLIKSGSIPVVFAYPERFGTPWLDNVIVVTMDEVKAVQLPVELKPPAQKTTARYRRLLTDGTLSEEWELPKGAITWMPSSEGWSRRTIAFNLRGIVSVLVIPTRQVDSFKKKHPDILGLAEWLAARGDKLMKAVTPVAIWKSKNQQLFSGTLWGKLKAGEIHDHALRSFISDVEAANTGAVDELNCIREVCSEIWAIVPDVVPAVDTKAVQSRYSDLYAKYPLLWAANYNITFTKKAVTDYVNAIYLASRVTPQPVVLTCQYVD